MNKSPNRTAIDTAGVDFFFIFGMMTDSMQADFPLIVRDLFLNCGDHMQKFCCLDKIQSELVKLNSPEKAFSLKILRLIYNGAKANDEYCLNLIKNLYKTYHKKEYGQLKRFRSLGHDALLAITSDYTGEQFFPALGRLLGICGFFKIRINESCSVIYLSLDDSFQMLREEIKKKKIVKTELSNNIYASQLKDFSDSIRGKDIKAARKEIKVCIRYLNFILCCFDQNGHLEHHTELDIADDKDMIENASRALSILSLMDQYGDPSFDDIQTYTIIYMLTETIINQAKNYDKQIGCIIGEEEYCRKKEGTLFKPGIIKPEIPKISESIVTQSETDSTIPPEIRSEVKTDINELRAQLSKKDNEIAEFRLSLRKIQEEAKRYKEQIRQYEDEKEELIALRNFVYNTQFEEEEPISTELTDMKEYIAEKNIAIIGGHVNRINKYRQEFPNWLYILPNTYRVIDCKILENKDYVLFFTDCLNHAAYSKFINAAREKKIPFGYLGTLNIKKAIKQIYTEIN